MTVFLSLQSVCVKDSKCNHASVCMNACWGQLPAPGRSAPQWRYATSAMPTAPCHQDRERIPQLRLTSSGEAQTWRWLSNLRTGSATVLASPGLAWAPVMPAPDLLLGEGMLRSALRTACARGGGSRTQRALPAESSEAAIA